MKLNKIQNLLKNQKKDMILLFLVMFFLSILELLSIGAIIPFLVITTGIEESNNLFFNYVIEIIKSYKINNPINYSLIIILMIFSFKTIFVIFLNFYKNIILKNFHFNTSKVIMRNFLNIPYSKFVKINTSKMINTINREIELLINSVINPSILFLLETLTILFFLIFIFIFDSYTFFLLLIFVVFTLSIFVYIFGKKIKSLGKERFIYHNKIQKDVLQALHGIREIKIFRKQNFFLNSFLDGLKKVTNITVIFNTISESQRNVIEFFLVIFFLLFVYLLSFNSDTSEILISIAFLFAIFIRLLPSMNRLYISLQSIRYYNSTLDNIYSEYIQEIENDEIKKDSKEKFESIEIKDGHFKYKDETIFENLNFQVNKNDFVGIFGESGSGKSTLVDIISGLLKIDKGKYLINGKDLNFSLTDPRNYISYVSQNTYLLDDSIKKNIAFGEEEKEINQKKLEEILAIPSFNFIKDLPYGQNSLTGDRGISLSGGQIQRISIARALYKDSEILILDESTSALDKKNEEDLMKIVNNMKSNKTIILISHKIDLLKDCDKKYELKDKTLKKV